MRQRGRPQDLLRCHQRGSNATRNEKGCEMLGEGQCDMSVASATDQATVYKRERCDEEQKQRYEGCPHRS